MGKKKMKWYKRDGDCEVSVYGSKDFRKLRQQAAYPNHKEEDLTESLVASVESGPVVPFSPGAGKSGSSFARTWDDAFKVKVGIKHNVQMNEPRWLMQMVTGT